MTNLTPENPREQQISIAPPLSQWVVGAIQKHGGEIEDFIIEAPTAADAYVAASLEYLGQDVINDQFLGAPHDARYERIFIRGRIKPGTEREIERLSLREKAESNAEIARRKQERQELKRQEKEQKEELETLTRLLAETFGPEAEYVLSRQVIWERERYVADLRWDAETVLPMIALKSNLNSYDAYLVGIELCRRCDWHTSTHRLGDLTDVLRELETPLLSRHECDPERLEQIAEEEQRQNEPEPFWQLEEILISGGRSFRFTNRAGASFDVDNQQHPFLSRLGDDDFCATAAVLLTSLNSAGHNEPQGLEVGS